MRPLGRPHDGPDEESNVLALCPNDHVRFDTGGIIVLDDLAIVDTMTGSTVGRLRTVRGHVVDTAQLAYHRERFGPSHATQSI